MVGHTLDGAGKSRIFLVGLGLIKNHQVLEVLEVL